MTDTAPSSEVRVRFAPSPTGYLHVGGARTALFNWLYARGQASNYAGKMILRIEDTDAERNKPELVEGIISALTWLGIDWDEGPFYQSQRTALYREAGMKLLASGKAFRCYCAAEKYAGGDHAPEPAADGSGAAVAQPAKGTAVRRITRCSCREGQPSTPGVRPALRFKVPTGGVTKIHDAVFGDREFSNDEIEDFVLLRSGKGEEEFGQSMYQLGVVVDDIDMRITHIIRGADHISNTPKQVLLYHALGAAPPVFAHVPLILGADKARLSKRHGATDVNMYRNEGFLPEAFRNFLALLGWSPGGDEEFMRTPDLLQRFSLAGVSRTNGVFDRPKLEWFNTQYLQKLPIADVVPQVQAELERHHLWKAGVGRRGGARVVHENRGAVAQPRAFAAGFRHVGARVFQRRFSARPRGHRQVLEGREDAEAAGEFGKCAGCAAGVESRCLRPCHAQSGGRRRREGGFADQRHARRDCGAGGGAAAL
jgi:glutamyl-tRNA synthetase